MTELLEFITGRVIQRAVVQGLVVWICWQIYQDSSSILSWAILLLNLVSEWLAWQQGLYQGALGFYRLDPPARARAEALFKQLEEKDE